VLCLRTTPLPALARLGRRLAGRRDRVS